MDLLRVNVFAGMANIPLLAGCDRGFFARERLTIEIQRTPSSLAQRAALTEATADIAHAAFDDVVAGEAAGADFVAVMGGDGGFQSLYAHASIRQAADLRGRTVAVDDPRTAYALVLRAGLRRAGLTESDYVMRPVGSTAKRLEALRDDATIAASMLAPPFSIQAEELGWHSLGSAVDILGAYQGTVAFCRRTWLAQNRSLLVRYLCAYLSALRWSLVPANREAIVAMVAGFLKIPESVARRSCAQALDEPGGHVAEAVLDEEGMRQVLELRARVSGDWVGVPPPAAHYVELGPWEEARRLNPPSLQSP